MILLLDESKPPSGTKSVRKACTYMEDSGFGEILLRRGPERGEEREECGFEFGDGVVGFDV